MSKVVIAGDASGTGTFTLSAPNGNTDRTLVLPDEAGTVLTSVSDLPAGNITGSVPASAMPAGSVIQVVHVDFATYQAFTVPADVNTSFTTGLTATITPASTSSKILAICSASLGHDGDLSVVRSLLQRTGPATVSSTLSAASQNTAWTTVIYTPTPQIMYPNESITWFDSPASTAACTYTLRIGGNTTGAVAMLNGSAGYGSSWGGVSHLTLLEVAG